MMIPAQLLEMAKEFEGFHQEVRLNGARMVKPYVCPAGFWTIGYGHLCGEGQPPISEGEAEELLMADLQDAVAATVRHCPVLLLQPASSLAAIADFTFNLGPGRLETSTLRRRINDRDWSSAGDEL